MRGALLGARVHTRAVLWRRIEGPVRLAALAAALSACGGARPSGAVRHASPSPRVSPAEPAPEEPDVEPYEATLIAEEMGDLEPLAREELSSGSSSLHLVLEASHCYRLVAVAEGRVALELVDEHGHALAAREGRVVRFESVCPRWSGSFELRVELDAPRGRMSLYEDDALASSSSDPASSTTR